MSRRVVILNDASTARGGATGLALLSARLLRARGIPVIWFAGDAGDNQNLRDWGVRVEASGGAKLLDQPALKAAAAGMANHAAQAALARLIAKIDTPGTVYHLHGWAQILSPAIFRALQPVAARTLVHAHDQFLACPNGAFYDYRAGLPCHRRPLNLACLTTRCDKRSEAHKLWRVARQVVLRRNFDQRLPWGGIALIHPGQAPLMALAGYAENRLIALRNPASPYTAQRIAAEGNRGLIFIGRVEADKGVPDLIAAAARARIPLTVVGEGSLRAALSATHPKVTFTGWQDRACIARLAAGARALVMPSRYPEPFGLVAAEASQSGLPVLVAETALLAPEIAKSRLGLTFDLTRPGSLDAAITAIRDMPAPEVQAISERGFACNHPLATSSEGWTDALLSIYDRLARDKLANRPS